MNPDATGTVYGLRDPRDGVTRYIGATTKTLTARLSGHLGGKAAPRVRAWVAELRAAGLRPETYAIKEGVPADELLAAEGDEITRIIAAGGTLLNENATARGRELLRLSREAQRIAEEKAAWRELANAALDLLGGPLPPGGIPGMEIPDVSWRFISEVDARYLYRPDLFLRANYPTATRDEGYRLWSALRDRQDEAMKHLRWQARRSWPKLFTVAGRAHLGESVDIELSRIADVAHASREETSRHMALAVWYMVAVNPWWQLASLGGLTEDDPSFITWAARSTETRKALTFLSAYGEDALAKLASGHDSPRDIGPGHLLGAVAAAYSGTVPPPAAHSDVKVILSEYANNHMLTPPMEDLLLRLDPSALDSVFGKDIVAEVDGDLGLPPGTSGRVLRGILQRTGRTNDSAIQHALDRSIQEFPVVTLPDYRGWTGYGVIAAKVVSASLVRRGLAKPEGISPKKYVAEVRALWTPQPVPAELAESA